MPKDVRGSSSAYVMVEFEHQLVEMIIPYYSNCSLEKAATLMCRRELLSKEFPAGTGGGSHNLLASRGERKSGSDGGRAGSKNNIHPNSEESIGDGNFAIKHSTRISLGADMFSTGCCCYGFRV